MNVYRDTHRQNSMPLVRRVSMTREVAKTLSRYASSIASPICCRCNVFPLLVSPRSLTRIRYGWPNDASAFVLLHRLGRRAKEGTIQCFLVPYGINCT